MESAKEYKENVDFIGVINHALIRCYDARASIDLSVNYNAWNGVRRYYLAVSSLLVLLRPVIPELNNLREKLKHVKFYEGSISKNILIIDEVLNEIIKMLNSMGLLIRSQSIRAGVVRVGTGGADKEGYEE